MGLLDLSSSHKTSSLTQMDEIDYGEIREDFISWMGGALKNHRFVNLHYKYCSSYTKLHQDRAEIEKEND